MNFKNSDLYAIKVDNIFVEHYNVIPGPYWSEIVMMKDSLEFFSNVIYIFDRYFLNFVNVMNDEVIIRFLLDAVPLHLQDKVYNVIYPNLIMKLLLSNRKTLLSYLQIDRIPDADEFYDALYDVITFHIDNYAEDEYYSLTDYSIKTNDSIISSHYFISFLLNYSKELYDQLNIFISKTVTEKIKPKIRFFKNPNFLQLDNHAINIAWRLQEIIKRKSATSLSEMTFIGIYINDKFYEWDIYDDNIYNNIICIWLVEGKTYEIL